jgi:hypothetical protein
MIAYQIKMKDGNEFILIAKDVQDARGKASVANKGSYCIYAAPIKKEAA